MDFLYQLHSKVMNVADEHGEYPMVIVHRSYHESADGSKYVEYVCLSKEGQSHTYCEQNLKAYKRDLMRKIGLRR